MYPLVLRIFKKSFACFFVCVHRITEKNCGKICMKFWKFRVWLHTFFIMYLKLNKVVHWVSVAYYNFDDTVQRSVAV